MAAGPAAAPEGRSVTEAEKAKGMLDIVRAVHAGGHTIIGPSWTVYDDLAALADAGDVDGMVRYFLAYKRTARGIRMRRRMDVFGKKTLESAERPFMAIARSG